MEMGQFWVPESAVGHKWSNFQPFGFKFGLYSLLLGISTCKNKKFHMGQIWALFWYWPFLGAPEYEASYLWIRIFLTFAILQLRFA